MKIPTRKIKSLSEFTKFLAEEVDDEFPLFRGQPVDQPLLPKLARLKFNKPILEAESEMIAAFKRQAMPYLKISPSSQWDWLALAQHHGMATRLLDWTSNPLMALWFAVSRPITEAHGVIWVFMVDKTDFVKESDNPFKGKTTKIFQPSHIAERIRAQSGYFTAHKYIEKEEKFIPFEKIAAYKNRLTKLIIPAEDFSEMRVRLDQYGTNQASIFPDLDGLCRHLEWTHSLLSDEQEDIAKQAL